MKFKGLLLQIPGIYALKYLKRIRHTPTVTDIQNDNMFTQNVFT